MDRFTGNVHAHSKKHRIYACNIQGSGGTKIPDLSIRTDDCDTVVLMETNCHEGAENKISMGNTVALVSTEGKEMSYGTAVLSRCYDREKDKITYKSSSQEIIAVTRYLAENISLTTIGAYRSPNLRAKETANFYNELHEVIRQRKQAHDDIIIVAMDDNSSNRAAKPFKRLEAVRREHGGVHVINEPTRKGKQPDHVIAFYDPVRYTVRGMVVPGVGDHSAMIVDILFESTINIVSKWIKREVVTDSGDPGAISAELEYLFSGYEHWLQQLENEDDPTGSSSKSHYEFTEKDVGDIAQDIVTKIERSRELNQTKVLKVMPEGKKPTLCKYSRQVQYQLNRLEQARDRLHANPGDQSYKETLVERKRIYEETCEQACEKIIERDMAKMRRDQKVNTRRFFRRHGYAYEVRGNFGAHG